MRRALQPCRMLRLSYPLPALNCCQLANFLDLRVQGDFAQAGHDDLIFVETVELCSRILQSICRRGAARPRDDG